MLQAQKSWPDRSESGDILPFPARPAALREFGRRSEVPRKRLIVDLRHEPVGSRWFRGAATLALLCGGALLMAPGFDPLIPPAVANPSAPIQNVQLSALAMPQLPSEVPADDELPEPKGAVAGDRDGLRRIGGDISEGLYWSLRAAGASSETAAEYLRTISTRMDVGEVSPFDRFELVIDKESGRLLFAGLDRAAEADVQLLKWTVSGRTDWFDAGSAPQASSGLMAPVAGRITSGFGNRVHPILRFSRFHGGIDFGASWGTPIVAAADGVVVGAGWAGGYGRQVRVSHGGDMVTTYSHMSQIAAGPGTPVRQGQVIGYVGSSGLSTGPHLHFEVRIGGQAVNPLTARLVTRSPLHGRELAAFKARMKELTSIPVKTIEPRRLAAS